MVWILRIEAAERGFDARIYLRGARGHSQRAEREGNGCHSPCQHKRDAIHRLDLRHDEDRNTVRSFHHPQQPEDGASRCRTGPTGAMACVR